MPTVTFALPGAPVSAGAMQSLDCSPTNTPAHTRAGSPLSDTGMLHSSEAATAFMTRLNRIITPQDHNNVATDTEGTDMVQKRVSAEAAPKPIEKNEHGKLPKVSSLDGSASVAASSKLRILLLYFILNLGLTLYNKAVMIKVHDSPTRPAAKLICFSFPIHSY